MFAKPANMVKAIAAEMVAWQPPNVKLHSDNESFRNQRPACSAATNHKAVWDLAHTQCELLV